MSIDTESGREDFQLNEISQLAVNAQSDRSLIPALWKGVERLIHKLCSRYYYSDNRRKLFEYEDLIQETYLRFEYAVKSYDPAKNIQFISYINFAVKTAYNVASGTRSQKRDMLLYAVSLDEPISGESDITLEDALEDESAVDSYVAIEDDSSVELILEQIEKLHNDTQRYCFTEYAYMGKTQVQIAKILKITNQRVQAHISSAASSLRRNSIIKAAYPEYYRRPAVNLFTTKGAKAFQSSFTSQVEDAVEQMEFLELLYGKNNEVKNGKKK